MRITASVSTEPPPVLDRASLSDGSAIQYRSEIALDADATSRHRLIDRAALALTLVASAAYFWVAIAEAHRPYWMDEVLAVWTARRPALGDVWEALRLGAEFSPPLYHVLLHAIVGLGFDDRLALRLPSIAAAYVAALSAFVLVRRRFDVPIACLALVVCLSGLLFPFAFQARQYAGVAACFALACVLWDGASAARVSTARALGIATVLSLAIGMHFYAVLLVPALGLMEAVRMVRHRSIRWPIVVALLAASASLLLWFPIMQAAASYSNGDTAAPDFYARPTLQRLFVSYYALLLESGALPPIVFAGVAVALGARVLAGRPAEARRPDLAIIAFVAWVFPLLVFAFATCVTGTFNVRYVVAAALGVALIVAQCVAAHRHGSLIACGLIAGVAASFLVTGSTSYHPHRQDAGDLLARAPEGMPIATGNGLRFFEVYEGADRPVAERFVFLTVPSLDRSPDPTNANQVQRWARIDPGLPIVPIRDFLADHAEFLLLVDPSSPDMVPDDLRERGYILRPVVESLGMTLFQVKLLN